MSSNPATNTATKTSNAASYVLCFTYTFEYTGDVCYFSNCFPYTYTDLKLSISQMLQNPIKSKLVRRQTLCKTIANNSCDLLTITEPGASYEDLMNRSVIIVTGRVHPGESNSSYMVQGFLDFITSDSEEASVLRQMYIFKVVPMLNPDGVINGNYQTSLSGNDLNRMWGSPDRKLHPTIYYTQQMIKNISKYHKIGYVLDLHGHSRKQGVFLFGCIPEKEQLRPASPFLREDSDIMALINNSTFKREESRHTGPGLVREPSNSNVMNTMTASPSQETESEQPSNDDVVDENNINDKFLPSSNASNRHVLR